VNATDLEKGLLEALAGFDILDAQEHLPPESKRVETQVDALTLFSHYAQGNLQRPGMTCDEARSLLDTKLPLDQRWRLSCSLQPRPTAPCPRTDAARRPSETASRPDGAKGEERPRQPTWRARWRRRYWTARSHGWRRWTTAATQPGVFLLDAAQFRTAQH